MDEILEMLGLNDVVRGIGALFALFVIVIFLVIIVGAGSGGGGSSYKPRLIHGSGEVIGSSLVCDMRSAPNHDTGQRELRFRVPCDQADSEAARYPARQFHTKRVEMLRIAYVNDNGAAVDGYARREALNAKGPINVGQYVTFYFDPHNPKRELTGTPPAKPASSSSAPSWGWIMGGIVLAFFAFSFLAVIVSIVTGFSFLSWLCSFGTSD